MEAKFNQVLEECLEQVLLGKSIADCLKQHPEYAGELKPLLLAALSTKQLAFIKPRSEFKSQAKLRLLSELESRSRKLTHNKITIFNWAPRWAVISICIAFIIIVAGGSTVYAASNSLPGNTLYPVKQVTEKVQSTFTFSHAAKINLELKFAERRTEEMAILAEKGNFTSIKALSIRLQIHMDNIQNLANKINKNYLNDKTLAQIEKQIKANEEKDMLRLQKVESKAPTISSKEVIFKAKTQLRQSYDNILSIIHNKQSQNGN